MRNVDHDPAINFGNEKELSDVCFRSKTFSVVTRLVDFFLRDPNWRVKSQLKRKQKNVLNQDMKS